MARRAGSALLPAGDSVLFFFDRKINSLLFSARVFGKSPLYCVRKDLQPRHEREGILIWLSLLEST